MVIGHAHTKENNSNGYFTEAIQMPPIVIKSCSVFSKFGWSIANGLRQLS